MSGLVCKRKNQIFQDSEGLCQGCLVRFLVGRGLFDFRGVGIGIGFHGLHAAELAAHGAVAGEGVVFNFLAKEVWV